MIKHIYSLLIFLLSLLYSCQSLTSNTQIISKCGPYTKPAQPLQIDTIITFDSVTLKENLFVLNKYNNLTTNATTCSDTTENGRDGRIIKLEKRGGDWVLIHEIFYDEYPYR